MRASEYKYQLTKLFSYRDMPAVVMEQMKQLSESNEFDVHIPWKILNTHAVSAYVPWTVNDSTSKSISILNTWLKNGGAVEGEQVIIEIKK